MPATPEEMKSQVWRWCEAPEFALHEPSKRDRRAVVQVAADYLDAYRQAVFVISNRGNRRGQASQCRNGGPRHLVVVKNRLAIHVEQSRPL